MKPLLYVMVFMLLAIQIGELVLSYRTNMLHRDLVEIQNYLKTGECE